MQHHKKLFTKRFISNQTVKNNTPHKHTFSRSAKKNDNTLTEKKLCKKNKIYRKIFGKFMTTTSQQNNKKKEKRIKIIQ